MGQVEVVQGDCRDFDWEGHLSGPVDCIVTDPPFGVDYRSKRGVTADSDAIARDIANDGSVDSALGCWLAMFAMLEEFTAKDCDMYVFTRWDVVAQWEGMFREIAADTGFTYKALLVWNKAALGMGDIDASWGASFELIMYLKKGRRDLNFQRSSVLSFDKVPIKDRIHPTEKPTGLLEVLIGNSTDTGDLVVDPFAGSGSTIDAARRLGRSALGVEKDASYVQLAKKRLAQQVLF